LTCKEEAIGGLLMGDSASTLSKATRVPRAMAGARCRLDLGSIQTVSNYNKLLIWHFSEEPHDQLHAFVRN